VPQTAAAVPSVLTQGAQASLPSVLNQNQGQNTGNLSASLTLPVPSALGGGSATLTMTVNTDALNVRTAPDANSSVVTALPQGTPVQVTGAPVNNWLPVKLNGLSGWMDGTYLSASALSLNSSTGTGANTGTGSGAGSAATLNSVSSLTAATFGNPTLGTPAGPETGLALASLPSMAAGTFIWPVTGRRISTLFKDIHQAIDIDQFPSGGNPAVATADGIVTFAGGSACCSYGLYVIVRHRNGYSSLYSHLSKVEVTQGQIVAQGQELGLTGNTGNSTGPHIHFAMYLNGLPFDPLKVLPNAGVDVEAGA
jgi:murein DD-endopeptidase MepM/ murein hydrolase activator NlpD